MITFDRQYQVRQKTDTYKKVEDLPRPVSAGLGYLLGGLSLYTIAQAEYLYIDHSGKPVHRVDEGLWSEYYTQDGAPIAKKDIVIIPINGPAKCEGLLAFTTALGFGYATYKAVGEI